MADFKTHLLGATLVSGLASTALISLDEASVTEALGYWVVGSVAGLLPDIDSDNSIALEWLFSGLGVVAACLIIVGGSSQLGILSLWLLAALGFVLVRYLGLWVFAGFTVHRGILHSWLANAFFALLGLWLSYIWLNTGAKVAWGVAAFIWLGASIHLLLDECYSVDLMGARLKSSWGSAAKLTDFSQPGASLLLLLATLLMAHEAPSANSWGRLWRLDWSQVSWF